MSENEAKIETNNDSTPKKTGERRGRGGKQFNRRENEEDSENPSDHQRQTPRRGSKNSRGAPRGSLHHFHPEDKERSLQSMNWRENSPKFEESIITNLTGLPPASNDQNNQPNSRPFDYHYHSAFNSPQRGGRGGNQRGGEGRGRGGDHRRGRGGRGGHYEPIAFVRSKEEYSSSSHIVEQNFENDNNNNAQTPSKGYSFAAPKMRRGRGEFHHNQPHDAQGDTQHHRNEDQATPKRREHHYREKRSEDDGEERRGNNNFARGSQSAPGKSHRNRRERNENQDESQSTPFAHSSQKEKKDDRRKNQTERKNRSRGKDRDDLKDVKKDLFGSDEKQGEKKKRKSKNRFAPHLDAKEYEEKIKEKQFFKGNLRINAHNRTEAYATCEGLPLDVFIDGVKDRNRALEGDIVVVELIKDLEKWKVYKDAKEEETEEVVDELLEGEAKGKIIDPSRQIQLEVPLEEESEEEEKDSEPKNDEDSLSLALKSLNISKTFDKKEVSPFKNKAGQPIQPTGRIVAIAESKFNKDQIGFIKPMSEDGKIKSSDRFCQFVPSDLKIPKMMVVINSVPDFTLDPSKYNNKLVHVQMQNWKDNSYMPLGKFKGVVGQAGDISAETDALLCVNKIDWAEKPWSQEILSSLPNQIFQIPQEEINRRKDLRKHRIFSIDPATAKDLDDALHITPLDDGNFEVGVHIADVSYFVTPGTELDKEAQHRSTTVYLIQKAIPMLPSVLCENLCSLNPKVDRLAFSVIWKLDPKGKILDEWMGRTVIRSCSKMAYQVAQSVIEGKITSTWEQHTEEDFNALCKELGPYDGHTIPQVVTDILSLYSISSQLRKARFDNGAVGMNNSKFGFKMDEFGNPIECFEYVTREANHMIEEFMLLANIAVARKISTCFPGNALLRNHIHPVDRKLESFQAMCESLNLPPVDITCSKDYGESLVRLKENLAPSVFSAIQTLGTRPMQLAKYFCSGELEREMWHHYALNVDEYTHFTSPIRRYADIVVHRTLQAALLLENGQINDPDIRKKVQQIPNQAKMHKIAENCNDRKLASRKAQEASSKLYLCLLLKAKPMVVDAVIVGLGERYITTIVPSIGTEVKIYTADLPLKSKKFDDGDQTLFLHWDPPKVSSQDGTEEGLRQHLKVLQVIKVEVGIKPDKFPMDFQVKYNPFIGVNTAPAIETKIDA